MYVASGGMLWLAGSVRSQEPQNAGTQASSPEPPGEELPADPPTTVFRTPRRADSGFPGG